MAGDKVKLHGMWASPFAKRVELALKVKGITYEYVEEDLGDKSPLLLQHNPVHKKVPILVHNGKAIVESYVILEYIDETWKQGPRFLPEDPYKRAQIRFWACFIIQLFESMKGLISGGEKVAVEIFEKMDVLEKGMIELGHPKFDGQNLGLLDILVSGIFSPHKAYEEAFGPVILDPQRYPVMHSWVQKLNELPVVKETVPPHEKLVAFLQIIKQQGPISA